MGVSVRSHHLGPRRGPGWLRLGEQRGRRHLGPPPGQTIDADTISFTVNVSRVGCNSGETGTVNDPDITVEDDRIVVAFTVSPGEPRSATCPGNPAVRYDVELPEPLGDRELVDPRCQDTSISDGDACTDDGIRYTPDAPPAG